MRASRFAAIGLLLAVGCTGKSPKVDNPVLGPAPPRMSAVSSPLHDPIYVNDPLNPSIDNVRPGDVVPTALTDGLRQSDSRLTEDQVVATVNGSPLFASDVLEPYSSRLEAVREKAPPEDFRKVREEIIERDLEGHIERRLLVLALKSTLKKEQVDQINDHLERSFEEEIEKMQKRLKVSSRHELAVQLEKEGTSLDALEDSFATQRMAMHFLGSKAQQDLRIGRNDLYDYYRAHREEYAIPARVRWQQILVDHRKHGGRQAAISVFDDAAQRLRRGVDFAQVARDLSDGPSASKGGVWDWTETGSLADQDVEQALFEQPIGQISRPFDGRDAFRFVKVLKRQQAGYVPFDDVQDEIRKKVEENERDRVTKEVIGDLKSKATIATIFDNKSNDVDVKLPFR